MSKQLKFHLMRWAVTAVQKQMRAESPITGYKTPPTQLMSLRWREVFKFQYLTLYLSVGFCRRGCPAVPPPGEPSQTQQCQGRWDDVPKHRRASSGSWHWALCLSPHEDLSRLCKALLGCLFTSQTNGASWINYQPFWAVPEEISVYPTGLQPPLR